MIIRLILLSWLLTACSSEARQSSLAQTLWAKFEKDEADHAHSAALDPDTLSRHHSAIAVLRDRIPVGYPEPVLPFGRLNRPSFLNEDIIELGQQLFFDARLSYSAVHGGPGTISCSSCHQPDRAFADGRVLSQGVDGADTHRNSPTLLNAAYYGTLTWANPVFPILEMQARIPLFGDDPVEMGLRGRDKETLQLLLESDPSYRHRFQKVFQLSYPDDILKGRMDYNHITAALAAYERSLIAFDTRFDRFLQGKASLSMREEQGARLFFGLTPLASGETLACSSCHAGIMLTNSFQYVRAGRSWQRQSFHNTGLYNVDGRGAYPPHNHGFANALELEQHPEWMGRFRVPGLRFVGQTGPYGHDGSLATLEDVIRHYAAGGRAARTEKGQNPFVDPLVKPGFTISESEIQDLLSFLATLDASGSQESGS